MASMKITSSAYIASLSFALVLLGGCSVDKLEARLQADPQCKSVINAKTGTLMPCPGTDKAFYKSIPALNTNTPKVTQAAITQSPSTGSISNPKSADAPVECKPQLHQKSGSLMPCTAP